MSVTQLLNADGTAPSAVGLELVRKFAHAVLAHDMGAKIQIRQQVDTPDLAPLRHIIDDMDGDEAMARYLVGG